MEEPKVNDGGGLFDFAGLIDTLIVDCNDLPKALFGGNGVRFCNIIVSMVQKLAQLKQGVANDLAERDKIIAEQKEYIDALAAKGVQNV